MNQRDHIDKLLQKLMDNTLAKGEFDELMSIFEDPDSFPDIDNKFRDQWESLKNISDEGMATPDTDALFHKIMKKIEHLENKKGRKRISLGYGTKWMGIAATLIFITGLLYVYKQDTVPPTDAPLFKSRPDTETITLQLGNGSIETISEDGERTITTREGNVVGSQQGTSLNYTGNIENNTLTYNTLTIPNGKRFDIVLSDGTKVKLNSGSSIKYPVQFLPGKSRKVFLMGEAYFDVAEDRAHPFIVNANDLEVQVLGTQFNVSHYPEDPEITTVLVEGSVELYKDGADRNTNTVTQLRPGQKAAWRGAENEMYVKQVDTEIYTAWKDGFLLFKGMPFSLIELKLERHFNITIENNDQFLADQIYTATFREENIEEILEAFKEDISFSYTRVDNKIIITNSKTN